jgi:16S rRNA (guanine(527)-N(7))-methyltransferase RsmG
MSPSEIASLLVPYIKLDLESPIPTRLALYLDTLLKWNARTNLTAVRSPLEIVARHFGESLFAATQIFSDPSVIATLADIGSGAGFPGLPIKLWAPRLFVTLIESHGKKSTFLREVVRALALPDVDVFAGRAEDLAATFHEGNRHEGSRDEASREEMHPASQEEHGSGVESPAKDASVDPSGCFDVVTMRAVEHYELVLPVAASLLQPAGRLALLIGEEQIPPAFSILPTFRWENPRTIPNSRNRVLLIGQRYKESS